MCPALGICPQTLEDQSSEDQVPPPSFCFPLTAPETDLTLYLGNFLLSPQQRHTSAGQELKLDHGCLGTGNACSHPQHHPHSQVFSFFKVLFLKLRSPYLYLRPKDLQSLAQDFGIPQQLPELAGERDNAISLTGSLGG